MYLFSFLYNDWTYNNNEYFTKSSLCYSGLLKVFSKRSSLCMCILNVFEIILWQSMFIN